MKLWTKKRNIFFSIRTWVSFGFGQDLISMGTNPGCFSDVSVVCDFRSGLGQSDFCRVRGESRVLKTHENACWSSRELSDFSHDTLQSYILSLAWRNRWYRWQNSQADFTSANEVSQLVGSESYMVGSLVCLSFSMLVCLSLMPIMRAEGLLIMEMGRVLNQSVHLSVYQWSGCPVQSVNRLVVTYALGLLM